MKDRYISMDALLKTLEEYHHLSCWNTDVCDADTVLRVLEVVENIVKNEPPIGPRQLSSRILKAKDCAIEVYAKMASDAVPVVRCKDCKFRISWMMNRNLRYICPESGMFPNGENDFCSYGKRKEGADND